MGGGKDVNVYLGVPGATHDGIDQKKLREFEQVFKANSFSQP
jgi:hypothetical protein